jgi:hypothetical protein
MMVRFCLRRLGARRGAALVDHPARLTQAPSRSLAGHPPHLRSYGAQTESSLVGSALDLAAHR